MNDLLYKDAQDYLSFLTHQLGREEALIALVQAHRLRKREELSEGLSNDW